MIVYKLVRKLKDGSLAPLFINKTMRFIEGEWIEAEFKPTNGYSPRKGFHCCKKPYAPHLKDDKPDRVWICCEVDDWQELPRPEAYGGNWILAQKLLPLGEV